jgi:nucleoside 2-deoxyribosyltransferase
MKTIKVYKGENMTRVYLASPFFNDVEIENLSKAEKILREKGLYVFSPREHEVREGNVGNPAWSLATFTNDIRGIDSCEYVVALYYGNYSDSGTAWEIGYAFATNKPVIVVHFGDSSNLMIHEGCHSNLMSLQELSEYDFETLDRSRYTGKMF